jgi:hypothetical protein
MNNINLNLGGLVGAVSCMILAAAIVFPEMPPGARSAFGTILIGCALAGAYAGNALWSLIFRLTSPGDEEQPAGDQVKFQHRDAH